MQSSIVRKHKNKAILLAILMVGSTAGFTGCASSTDSTLSSAAKLTPPSAANTQMKKDGPAIASTQQETASSPDSLDHASPGNKTAIPERETMTQAAPIVPSATERENDLTLSSKAETTIEASASAKPRPNEAGEKREPVTLYFSFDETSLDSAAQAKLDKMADQALMDPSLVFTISTYTDTVGPKSYNDLLAKKRAEIVAAHLAHHGVPAYQIVLDPQGEDPHPLANHLKRRADIELSPKVVSSAEPPVSEPSPTSNPKEAL